MEVLATHVSISMSKALVLKSCFDNGFRSFKHLKEAHGRLFRLGLDQEHDFINTLLEQCFHFSNTHYSKQVFKQTQNPNIFLFNTMIRGLVSSNLFQESINFYHMLRSYGLFPNNFTYPFALKACGKILNSHMGRKIHNLVVKLGFDGDVFVNTSLVGMYAKCGLVFDAHKVFDDIPHKNVGSWTSIIGGGYIDAEQFELAVGLFRRFLEMGLRPDTTAVVRIVSTCAELGELVVGEWVHSCVNVLSLR